MTRRITTLSITGAAAALLMLSSTLHAVPTTVQHQNLAQCDPLVVPTVVDELGTGNFPPDELIKSAFNSVATLISCQATDIPTIPQSVVEITNLTNILFSDLWYVADPSTSITNVDGLVNNQSAFKIDRVGINTPLLGEDILADGVFQPGETWLFMLQDYSNALGLPPEALGSIGVPTAGDTLSSGSIIAVPVPEPASAALVAIGPLLLLARQRRNPHA